MTGSMTVQWTSFLGGLGLFLLGMQMLSGGLKLAAGTALEKILEQATQTRWRGLLSGAVTTALVQSSSAVTVATIGFVNASLLTLGSAIWVLFGANLGTTATGWIVSLAGLKVDLSLAALPLVALGVALKLAGREQRISASGEALAGFGLLFYGIVLMQTGFADMSSQWQIPQGSGLSVVLLQLLAGIFMTALMQSSSASIAIALSAAQTGLIGIEAAAAVVIGANIGTTVTAMLAAVGATPRARRVASAHVLFNLITASAALIIMWWLIPGITQARLATGWGDSAAVTLAIFNTLFNILGVMIMWPLAAPMTRMLEQRFTGSQVNRAEPKFLDRTTLPVPNMAAQALSFELERMLDMAWHLVQSSLSSKRQSGSSNALARDLTELLKSSEAFVDQMNRNAMDEATGIRLARLLRVRRYLENGVEALVEADEISTDVFDVETVKGFDSAYVDGVKALTEQALGETFDASQDVEKALAAVEVDYQDLKASLLEAGAEGKCRIDAMELGLRRISLQRRALQQLLKASRWLAPDDAQVTD